MSLWGRAVWEDLLPTPDRCGGTIRITVSAVLVAAIMLTFRMPFLYMGPYLVFILSQRDMFVTRLAALLGVGVGIVVSILIYGMAWLAWDTAWLRLTLWFFIFYGGYFLMRICVEPKLILGPLVVVALFTFIFDVAPDPNRVVSLVGWLWAILGLVITSTFFTQWIFAAPSGVELLRRQMREILAKVEKFWVARAFGRSPEVQRIPFEQEELTGRIEKLGATGALRPEQAENCRCLFRQGCLVLTSSSEAIACSEKNRQAYFGMAAWTRWLRRRVLLGEEVGEYEHWPNLESLRGADQELAANCLAVGRQVLAPEAANQPLVRSGFLRPDWRTNPLYVNFALKATLATMGCYCAMMLLNWNGIHTCLITCVVTALADAEAQNHKQFLRITGAVIGGVLGIGAVVFLIPLFDSFSAYLLILAAGTSLAAWVSLGSERIAYAGWQIGLAFYMTLLQDPHPTTKLDIIRDRWVGIFVGILAMKIAFVWFSSSPQIKDKKI